MSTHIQHSPGTGDHNAVLWTLEGTEESAVRKSLLVAERMPHRPEGSLNDVHLCDGAIPVLEARASPRISKWGDECNCNGGIKFC